MTAFNFPIRVSVATGERLEPTGADLRALPWVQGAAQTLPGRVRRAYSAQQRELVECLAVLRSKRPSRLEAEATATYGPRRRPAEYRGLHGRPLPADMGGDDE